MRPKFNTERGYRAGQVNISVEAMRRYAAGDTRAFDVPKKRCKRLKRRK